MQIIKVQIHNFCSVHDGTFELQDYNLLIGANNAGKSNTINAIRAFYEDIKYDAKSHKPLVGETDENCWVEITFQLTPEEYTALEPVYQVEKNLLKLRRILSAPPGGTKPGLYAYEASGLGSKPYKGSIGRIIYIPAVSKVEDQTKTSGPSPLRDLINDILKTITKTSEAYQDLAKAFEAFAENVKSEKTAGERSIQGLEENLTSSLSAWNVQFNLNIVVMTTDDIVKTLISPRLVDPQVGEEQRIEQFGQGLQREIIFQLIRIKSEYLEQSDDNSTDLTLFLFEEPEVFLHPTQQIELAERLRDIGKKHGSQVLLSTHSPHFVSYESDNLSTIIRLHRDNGSTILGQISDLRLHAIQTDNQQITAILQSSKNKNYHPHADDQTLDMEAIKYFMWLDPNRCAMFFAANVLLVEGATEAIFINYLIKHKQLNAPQGTFVLDCLGKFNIHRFMQILSELKVSHSVLFDDDNGEDIHPQLETFIRSFKTGYTKQIEVLSGCIEDELGVTLPKSSQRKRESPHRKPQHLLYQYQTGKIDSAKLSAFIAKVEALVN